MIKSIKSLEAQLKGVRYHLTRKDKQLGDQKPNFDQIVCWKGQAYRVPGDQIGDIK